MDDLGHVFEKVSRYFSLLAEPMRIRVLHAICETPKTVGQIVEETGGTQTNISRHLNTMFRAGVLTRRKDGNFIFYGVADTTLTEICRTVCVHIAGSIDQSLDRHTQQDLIQLARGLEASELARRKARTGSRARARTQSQGGA